ncbi:lipopolysaccharide transport periplasmic protein LptA [Pollutimonas harenae]|uniref:Lipopolysaccharide export system protein LptA n=1 Tax=Pollutimonas harenae TaxID=657015 RepID=A0A853GWS8_9BURK|nr:lipopolysaccharide transport periplasmic protein LptA [Pollutimonas harenae]NYT84220.1 lipopolysaccharide transport periplasmic protein LptA [Pollutimonas harenae]TEA73365.1 lipopolysaccharide transport periplasmic protein LptA [Pollutimonas harenae]
MTLQRPRSSVAWLLTVAMACMTLPTLAQTSQSGAQNAAAPTSGEQPAAEPDTLILSDTLDYDDVKKESVFTGNVIMTRGPMTLHSDKLTMREDAEGFQYGTATVEKGKLVRIRQEKPEGFEVIKAEGLRAEYNGKTEELEMIGQAVITRYVCGKPFDSIRGERVIYKQKSDTYQAFGGPNSAAAGGRVRSLAKPRASSEKAAAECKQKSQ